MLDMAVIFIYGVHLAWCVGVRGDINNNSDNVCVADGLQKSKNIKTASDDTTSENCSTLNVHAKEFSLERSKTAPQSIMNGAKPE